MTIAGTIPQCSVRSHNCTLRQIAYFLSFRSGEPLRPWPTTWGILIVDGSPAASTAELGFALGLTSGAPGLDAEPLMQRLALCLTACLLVDPVYASSRPMMDQWLNGEETDRLRKDLSWVKLLTETMSHSFQTLGLGGVGSGCHPERNVCFDSVTTVKDGRQLSLVTYTLAGAKDQVLGRKICFREPATANERICVNYYTSMTWHEVLQPGGSWEMSDSPRQGAPLPYSYPAGEGTQKSDVQVEKKIDNANSRDPTPEEYVAKVGGDAQIVPAGMLAIDGQKVLCGTRPTVLDNKLDDYAAAYPGFIILNPKLLARIKSLPVKLWIYAQGCGYQFRGPDPNTADCFAVQRGRRQGW